MHYIVIVHSDGSTQTIKNLSYDEARDLFDRASMNSSIAYAHFAEYLKMPINVYCPDAKF